MRRLDVLVLIIVILIIIGIAIWSNSEKEEVNSPAQEDKEDKLSYLQRIQSKIQQIESDVKAEAETLHLTTEMEEFLEKRVRFYSAFFKAAIAFLVIGIFCSFYFTGETLLASLFTTAGICSVGLAVIPFLFMSRVLDISTVMQASKKWVRKVIYNKFNYDPQVAKDLKTSISLKTSEINVLKERYAELNSNPG